MAGIVFFIRFFSHTIIKDFNALNIRPINKSELFNPNQIIQEDLSSLNNQSILKNRKSISDSLWKRIEKLLEEIRARAETKLAQGPSPKA